MSLEASEIVTNMLHSLHQDIIALHNQYVNDMQAILSQVELRIIELAMRIEVLEQANETSKTP